MNKRICIIAQVILLAWFFLDMIGVCFNGKCLVARSYAQDGVFFLVYLIAFLLFVFRDRIGKWVMAAWLSMWLFTQFISHEWYTLFGSGFMGSAEGKIEHFSQTIQWVESSGRYVPDVYHTILHILIAVALVMTILYIAKSRKKRKNADS